MRFLESRKILNFNGVLSCFSGLLHGMCPSVHQRDVASPLRCISCDIVVKQFQDVFFREVFHGLTFEIISTEIQASPADFLPPSLHLIRKSLAGLLLCLIRDETNPPNSSSPIFRRANRVGTPLCVSRLCLDSKRLIVRRSLESSRFREVALCVQ